MTARNRQRSLDIESFYRNIYGSVTTGTNNPGVHEVCDDVTGHFGSDNYFDLIRWVTDGGVLEGALPGRVFQNQGTALRYLDVLYPPTSDEVAILDISKAATKAASITNPSRPEISLPTFIGELKDFPRMLRHAGRFLNGTAYKHGNNWLSASKEVASENLAIQFGWAPLISDLIKMGKFQDRYEKRLNELDRLYSGRGLKRRVTLNQWGGEATANKVAWSSSGVLLTNVPVQYTSKSKSWAVVRWKPGTPTSRPPANKDFTKMLLGLTPGAIPSTAWELLPWSWLVDYFTNVGDYISLTNNTLLAQCTGGTIMTQGDLRVSWSQQDKYGPDLILTPGSRQRISKHRRKFTAFDFSPLPGSLPILSVRQMSILSSLAVARI